VLAAGGIADGRGLAAALVLGASGAMLGTRFEASREALVPAWVTGLIVDGRCEDTERHHVFNVAEGGTGPISGPNAPCVTRLSTSGAGARTSLRRTPSAGRPIRKLLTAETVQFNGSARARPST
jgi:hypothetical protein